MKYTATRTVGEVTQTEEIEFSTFEDFMSYKTFMIELEYGAETFEPPLLFDDEITH